MAALRINILSNYIGQIWMVLIGILFMPLYMRLLGMEAFGLVGIMLSFQAILQLFDFGIGTTTNRELSRYVYQPNLIQQCRSLVHSAEIFIWAIALTIILFFYLFSTPIATYWLNASFLTHSQVSYSLFLMGIAIALFWPSTFYASCFSGLEQQPLLNLIQVIFTTLRFAGVVPVLYYIAPTIENFLYWYIIVGSLQSLIMCLLVWFYLPVSPYSTKFNYQLLIKNKKFAGGVFTISLLALAVNQIDRFVLISLRPLEEMGYYTLAISVAAGVGRMIHPMFNAIYPRFSRLVAKNDLQTLTQLYHLSSQALVVMIASIPVIILVFSYEVLYIWTGDLVLAEKVSPILKLLILGTILNGLMNIPYALQLAYGWTNLTIRLNLLAIILSSPLCIWAVNRYGVIGAVIPWVLSNSIFIILGVPLMHRYLLLNETKTWYLKDNLTALIVGGVVVYIFYYFMPQLQRDWLSFLQLILMTLTTMFACVLVTPLMRKTILNFIFKG